MSIKASIVCIHEIISYTSWPPSHPPIFLSSQPQVGRYSADVELQEETKLRSRVQTSDIWLLVASYQIPAAWSSGCKDREEKKTLQIWDSVMLFLLSCGLDDHFLRRCNCVYSNSSVIHCMNHQVFVYVLVWCACLLYNSLSVYYYSTIYQYRADCIGSNVLAGSLRDCPLCWHSLRHVCLWVLRAIWGKINNHHEFE